MTIRFRCPHCRQKLGVPDSLAGKHGRCPKCRGAVDVPADSAEQQADHTPRPAAAHPQVEAFTEEEQSPTPSDTTVYMESTPRPGPRPTEPPPSEDTTGQAVVDTVAAAGLDVPTLEGEPQAKAGWLPRAMVGLAMLVVLVALAIRGYFLYDLRYGPTAAQAGAAQTFVTLSMVLGALSALACLGILISGIAALRLSEMGRNWLMITIIGYLLVHLLYAGLINVPALHPPGAEGGFDTRVMEGVFLAGAVLLLAAPLVYLWRFGRLWGTGKPEAIDVIDLVDRLLKEALKARASDVHFEPGSDGVSVRYRIDGVLHPIITYPTTMQDRIVSRVKVMGRMDIAERRLPQDGGATLAVGNKGVDLRISTVPSNYGERAVIRLLDPATSIYGLEGLGMGPDLLPKMDAIIESPHGVFFCTGPTGSGKTTTLYAALLRVNAGERNVLTVEDPVEYQLPGISQLPVGKKKGMTFASGLRSMLRQDPDVIMVGEVRDTETADMVIRAAQTGHLVLSTLHTNDSAGAVTRLLDLEIEPFLLASTLTGVLAQRLVRRVCPDCGEQYEPGQEEVERLGLAFKPGMQFRRGRGCVRCLSTGYYGRIGLFELLMVDDAIRELIMEKSDAWAVRKAALSHGMISLREEGARKVAQGITSSAEVWRVIRGTVYDDEGRSSSA